MKRDLKALKTYSQERLIEAVHELSAELDAREKDLAVFRDRLAKANQSLEALIAKVAEEVKTAALIQKVLVPTEFPNIPGFEFSTKFVASPISGGDYFDIFEHEDRLKFGVVVASSSGYGMSALLLSVLLKITGRQEARRGLAPDKLLQAIAADLEPSLSDSSGGADRANLFYATLDRRNLELAYAVSGMIFGAVLRKRSGEVERLICSDSPIEKGSFAKLPEIQKAELEAQDRVVIVSSGGLAAKNKDGEIFGEDRLVRALSVSQQGAGTVHDARNEILYAIEKYRGEIDLPQDVTVVVLEVKDRVIRLASRR